MDTTIALVLLAALALSSVCAAQETADAVFPRGSTAFVVASPKTALEKRIAGRLSSYIKKVCGKPVKQVGSIEQVPHGASAIVLVGGSVKSPIPVAAPGKHPESFALLTGRAKDRTVVVAEGRTDRGLVRAVQRLIIASEQRPDALVIPELKLSESPWIEHREWTICPWVPEFVRGTFRNPYADARMNILNYSQKRLSDYVEMFDWFGFSGCQLIETCYTYAVLGSPDATADWQKRVMRLVRENGQEVSLWAWTAQFTAFGWVDPDVSYTPAEGVSAFDDPNVRRGFEKYYNHYAEFAPYIDRFFFHFFDPGQLRDHADVVNYMRLLESKLKAKNPKIEMGVDAWAGGDDYLSALVRDGFSDYLLLEMATPDSQTPEKRNAIHAEAKKLGLRMGVWGWYITEYETDQLASMYVNSQLIKSVYQDMKNGPFKVHPDIYWSEMEAHHLNNIYSMYAAAQLLWNPERDPHQILEELTSGIWGPINGAKVLKALDLIEDMRTGPNWDTYWWTSSKHQVGTADPADDLRRANEALSALAGLKPDPGYVCKFPLPYPPETFVELMTPHLRQIKLFAEFRLKVADIHAAAEKGASKEVLEKMLKEAWQPVPELGTWVGTFGFKELREQKKIVAELAAKHGLSVKDPDWLRYLEADRVLQVVRELQRGQSEPFVFDAPRATAEFFWPESRLDRFEKLVADGVVEKVGEDKYRLVDWESWARK